MSDSIPSYEELLPTKAERRWVDIIDRMEPGSVQAVDTTGVSIANARANIFATVSRRGLKGHFGTRLVNDVLYVIRYKPEDVRS